MIRILFTLTLVFASYSASATDIQLRPGSSATIRAGDEATVTCGGGGGGGRERCECVVGNRNTDASINCNPETFGYLLKIRGAPVKQDGCWREASGAGNGCRTAMKDFPECN